MATLPPRAKIGMHFHLVQRRNAFLLRKTFPPCAVIEAALFLRTDTPTIHYIYVHPGAVEAGVGGQRVVMDDWGSYFLFEGAVYFLEELSACCSVSESCSEELSLLLIQSSFSKPCFFSCDVSYWHSLHDGLTCGVYMLP